MGALFSSPARVKASEAQTAFLFIKPHANKTPEVRALVTRMLHSAGIKITSEGDVDGPTIERQGLIDRHYVSIASKATLSKPHELSVPAETFAKSFGEEWATVLQENRAFNAIDVQQRLGISAQQLGDMWDAARSADRVAKLGGGFYCALLETAQPAQRIYTFNAFFMSLRAQYTAPTASIHYYTLQLPRSMHWSEFRGTFVGPTDPAQAPPASLRGTIYKQWRELGLASPLDKGDNGVHASASPLESLAERRNWLHASIESDAFARKLLDAGINAKTVEARGAWTSHEPHVAVPGGLGRRKSLFDMIEGLDSEACAKRCIEAAAAAVDAETVQATASTASLLGPLGRGPYAPSAADKGAGNTMQVVDISSEDAAPPASAVTPIIALAAAPGAAPATGERLLASKDEVSVICRETREGRVLRKNTILKADHYPSCHNTSLTEQLPGAPNFRQPSASLPVYGTAAPTVAGLVNVCERVRKAHGGACPVVWHNLRQEPCIYVHGRPFCVKERDNPFKALQNKGVQAADVEEAEALLKLEVLAEAKSNGGKLLVLDETQPEGGGLAAMGELVHYFEVGVVAGCVWTPREVYEMAQLQMGKHAAPLVYKRVPITDEEAPREADFDAIVSHMREAHSADPSSAYVFNCALGRGRTTTGVAIACLVWRSIAANGQAAKWDLSGVRLLADGDGAASTGGGSAAAAPDYAWGEYKAVHTLVRQLPQGVQRKAFVDRVIDECGHMQNLRSEILPKKRQAEDEGLKPSKREAAKVTGKKYLERYLYLILFEGYLCCALDGKSSLYEPPLDDTPPLRFKEWLHRMSATLYPTLDALSLE